MKRWYVVALVVFLFACGSGLNGTYADENGITRYTFRPDGKVSMTMMGIETETEYRVEDGKVKIGPPERTLVMTILEDGSIQGPMGVILRKTSD